MSREDERALNTADFVEAGAAPRARDHGDHGDHGERELPDPAQRERSERMTQVETRDASAAAQRPEPLAELFAQDAAAQFRSRWDAVQIGFVDDPKQAVKQADELVAQVMKSLAESFSRQRATIEGDMGGGNEASTENLRLALQRYRSFFQRLLSL